MGGGSWGPGVVGKGGVVLDFRWVVGVGVQEWWGSKSDWVGSRGW